MFNCGNGSVQIRVQVLYCNVHTDMCTSIVLYCTSTEYNTCNSLVSRTDNTYKQTITLRYDTQPDRGM